MPQPVASRTCLVLSVIFPKLVPWLPQPSQPYIYTAASEAESQQQRLLHKQVEHVDLAKYHLPQFSSSFLSSLCFGTNRLPEN